MDDKIIEIKNVYKSYDDKPVVKNLSLAIRRGEFVTLLGPSGCGKTTTLRMIAGFEQPTEGKIFFNGEDITQLPPHKRNINTVFQKYALFPHLTVFGNIAFGLKLKLVPDGEPVVDKKGNTVQKCANSPKRKSPTRLIPPSKWWTWKTTDTVPSTLFRADSNSVLPLPVRW